MSEEELEIEDEIEIAEEINYNDNIIRIEKDEIILKLKRGNNNYVEKSIAGFGLDILYYAVDEIKNKIIRYTFYANDKLFYSYEINTFLDEYKDLLFEGRLSRNVIRYIFWYESRNMTPRRAEYINGWNDGWKLPINDETNDFMLMCHTQEQRIVLNNVINAYKKYSDENKIKLCRMLNYFFDITKYDTDCAIITAAWSLVALFKGYFMKYFKLFPPLGTEGLRNTGKTSFMDIIIIFIWSIYKEHMPGDSIKTIASAPQAVTSGAFPIYWDDMQVHSTDFISLVKEMATSQSYHVRYNPNGSIREKVHRVASMAMSSNTDYLKDNLGDLANNSRAIILNPKIITSKDDKWIRLGLKIKMAKYFSLVYDYTKDWTEKDLDKLVKEVEKKYNIDERMKEIGDNEFINKNYPRIRETYTILLVGILLWEKIFNVKFKIDNLLKILVKSRGFLLSELVHYFLLYCKEAKEYFLSDIGSDEKPIPKNHPPYLKHELIINSKGWGLFTPANLKDFSKMCEKKFRGLKDCCNQVIEGLEIENKDWLFVHKTKYKGQDIYCIKVSPEILDYDMREIDEPYISEIKLYTDEEMEDESVELDFDELNEDLELLEVDGIDEKDIDTSK